MTSEPRTTISPRSPVGSSAPSVVHDRHLHQRRGPPGGRQPLGARPSRPAAKWSAGGSIETIIGASVWPNSWAITGPIRVSASSSRAVDIGAAPYQKHCSEREVGAASAAWPSSM